MKASLWKHCLSVGCFYLLCVSPLHAQEPGHAPNQAIITFSQNNAPDELEREVQAKNQRTTTVSGRIQNALDTMVRALQNKQSPESKLEKVRQLKTSLAINIERKLASFPTPSGTKTYFLYKSTKANTEELRERFLELEEVTSTEPNYLIHEFATPNDSSYPLQWNLPKIEMPQAWDIQPHAASVVVAIIDSGVDYTHTEFNPTTIILGPDFINGDNDPMDDRGHGTSVAGVVGAITNNGAGIAGTAWTVKLMPIKVLDGSGNGTTAELISALAYAADNGAKVANLSLGGAGQCAQMVSLQDALHYARNRGVTVVVAAGNAGIDAGGYSPANCSGVVTVGATTPTDSRAAYSNFGATVDIAAPGGTGEAGSGNIYTTLRQNAFGFGAGTSLATPHVSGAVALLLAKNPSLTPDQTEEHLKTNSDSIVTDQPIGPRLNAYRALVALAGTQPSPNPLFGDVNGDGLVDATDLQTLLAYYQSGISAADLRTDNKINNLDAGFLISHL